MKNGDVGVSDVSISKTTDEHVIDGAEEKFFKASSVESYFLCSLVALENCRRMSKITGPVISAGTVGSGPGLAGGMKGVKLRMLKTAGVTVRYSNPSVPSPRWDWTEVALAMSCRCTSAMVLYPG